ncbi:MAG: hypothetical protein Q8P56_03240 [Candidatus Uhrbacteria bacterium]|nr:hypothetical protein [Candidatus Uhrbacteria bacterium]
MTDKPIQPKFTVLEGGEGSVESAMSAQEARLILTNPNVTLGMITQPLFNAILDDEAQLQQEQDSLESGKSSSLDETTLASVGHRCIDQIAASLAVSNSQGIPDESEVRAHLEKLFREYMGQHTSMTFVPGESEKPKLKVIQGGKDKYDKKRAEEKMTAHNLCFRRDLTLDEITERSLEILLDLRLTAISLETTRDKNELYQAGEEVIRRLMHALSKSTAQKMFNEDKAHAVLESRLDAIVQRRSK